MVRHSKVSHLFVWLTAGTHCYGIPLSKKENLILFCVFIFPEPTAVKYCSGAMRLQESRGNKRLERSDRLSWCCFNGKCGHLPMPMCLKDLILRNAKTRVNNRPPIEFSEPTSLQESLCKHLVLKPRKAMNPCWDLAFEKNSVLCTWTCTMFRFLEICCYVFALLLCESEIFIYIIILYQVSTQSNFLFVISQFCRETSQFSVEAVSLCAASTKNIKQSAALEKALADNHDHLSMQMYCTSVRDTVYNISQGT